MTTGYVVDLENGHDGYCVESLVGVTYCGETFDPAAVDRELYAIDRGHDHPHNTLCLRIANRRVDDLRGEGDD